MINRRYEKIYSPFLNREMDLLAFGHFGAPLIAFPSGGGQFFDFESNEMVAVLEPLINEGKIKVYCPPSADNETWLNNDIDPHWRAIGYKNYEQFIIENLVPTIRFDCKSTDIRIGLVGCSLGAYHAVNLALKHPAIFNYALGMSGRYDLEKIMGTSSGSEEVYFNNPMAFGANLHGETLEQIRHNTHLTLVCGQGAWEDKCLEETRALGSLFAEKGISHEQDIWGQDVEHHWHWWRKQITHHLEKRFG